MNTSLDLMVSRRGLLVGAAVTALAGVLHQPTETLPVLPAVPPQPGIQVVGWELTFTRFNFDERMPAELVRCMTQQVWDFETLLKVREDELWRVQRWAEQHFGNNGTVRGSAPGRNWSFEGKAYLANCCISAPTPSRYEPNEPQWGMARLGFRGIDVPNWAAVETKPLDLLWNLYAVEEQRSSNRRNLLKALPSDAATSSDARAALKGESL